MSSLKCSQRRAAALYCSPSWLQLGFALESTLCADLMSSELSLALGASVGLEGLSAISLHSHQGWKSYKLFIIKEREHAVRHYYLKIKLGDGVLDHLQEVNFAVMAIWRCIILLNACNKYINSHEILICVTTTPMEISRETGKHMHNIFLLI